MLDLLQLDAFFRTALGRATLALLCALVALRLLVWALGGGRGPPPGLR